MKQPSWNAWHDPSTQIHFNVVNVCVIIIGIKDGRKHPTKTRQTLTMSAFNAYKCIRFRLENIWIFQTNRIWMICLLNGYSSILLVLCSLRVIRSSFWWWTKIIFDWNIFGFESSNRIISIIQIRIIQLLKFTWIVNNNNKKCLSPINHTETN